MRKAAKILTAGTLLATPLCLLLAGAATSQTSQVLNNQVQLGDVFATQTLDVVDVEESTSVVTPATGNSFIGSAVGTPIDVRSTQQLSGNVSADATLNVEVRSGYITAIATAATGNSAESNVEDTGLSGASVQSAGPVSVQAFSRYAGPDASTTDLSVSTQAVVNSQGYGLTNSASDVTLTQDSEATAQADNGVTIRYLDGVAVSSALATVNNVTAVGAGYSEQSLDITQNSTGATAQATSFTFAGNAQDITAQATATANNLSATNEGGVMTLSATQTNDTNVSAEAYLSSFQFGAATANAYGVGNSVMAGNYGPEIVLDNSQLNTGGVNVISTFVGDNGYDAYVSSTAIGNAVTGFACSACEPGRATVSNSQRNEGGVSAQGAMTITGQNRVVNSVTSATGNTATFYVTRPQ